MALTVTVNRFASSNVQPVHRRERKRPTAAAATTTASASDIGRRGLLLLSTVAAAPQVTDSRTELLQSITYLFLLISFNFHPLVLINQQLIIFSEYLKKSDENKAKNDKEVKHFLLKLLCFSHTINVVISFFSFFLFSILCAPLQKQN